MRYLKIVLSVLALLIGAVAVAMTGGSFGAIPPQFVGFTMALAGGVSVLGIQPWPLTPFLSKLLSVVAGVLASIQGIHAASITATSNPHPWVWVIVGAITVIMGQLGKSPVPHATVAEGSLMTPSKPDIAPPKP
jgi:hypothetical protein